jgi:hypothetical protein
MSGGSTTRQGLLRKKPVEAFVTETRPDVEGGELSRSIGLFTLTMFGVGATIGTGIFIVLAEAVPEAGPGVIVSFVIVDRPFWTDRDPETGRDAMSMTLTACPAAPTCSRAVPTVRP